MGRGGGLGCGALVCEYGLCQDGCGMHAWPLETSGPMKLTAQSSVVTFSLSSRLHCGAGAWGSWGSFTAARGPGGPSLMTLSTPEPIRAPVHMPDQKPTGLPASPSLPFVGGWKFLCTRCQDQSDTISSFTEDFSARHSAQVNMEIWGGPQGSERK